MAKQLKIGFLNDQHEHRLPWGTRLLLQRLGVAVLRQEEVAAPAEVCVRFVTPEAIRALNAEYRGIDRATDVLSFPLAENGAFEQNPENQRLMLGDVVISVHQTVEQAKCYGHSVQRELGFLFVHSMLHLFGYDHVEGTHDAARMRKKEEAVLRACKLSKQRPA